MRAPVATYASRRATLLLAAVPVAGFTVWAVWHAVGVVSAFGGHGNRLAFAWALSFLMLYWVVLSWLEKPRTVTARQQAQLDRLVTVVQIPIFNESPDALRACLESVLAQTRLPDRVRCVDDGSFDPLPGIRDWFLIAARNAGIDATWQRTMNRGKRHAQTLALIDDDSDIIVTLDSDSILDAKAIAEGLKPFADPKVLSVAGMVAVLNTKSNWLTLMTAMLYTPFTRSFRSAQSVIKRVTVNSGTLAFYRGVPIRKYLDVYAYETFWGRPMQMNDDSMMTFFCLIEGGDCVHQPTSVAYTLVPERLGQYANQQLRWMRGTLCRYWWYFRYCRPTSPVFWMPLLELIQLLMSIAIPVALFMQPAARADAGSLLISTLLVGAAVNWGISLRVFMIRRTDASLPFHILLVLGAPIAGVWRLLVVKPMYLWAMLTFWQVGSWGTRGDGVEVGLGGPPSGTDPDTVTLDALFDPDDTVQLPLQRVHGAETTAELDQIR